MARLDAQGRAYATVLNMRQAGQTGKNLPGFYDADTAMGVDVELPDTALTTGRIELEGGKVVELPEAWKKAGAKNATIRLGGFQAHEVYFPPPKQNTLNPAGVRAQQALVKMFQQGWTDAKEKNRFIFKVRVVGSLDSVPPRLREKYPSPYLDKYGRIVTDVYIASNPNVKIAEIVWVNPEDEMIKQGHGRAWQWR